MRDPYKTLGVRPDAGVDEIKAAWRTMAKAIHPDHNRNDPTATARFAEVGRAYETLKDPKKRSQYDKVATMSEAKGGNGPTIMQQRQAAREAEERAKQARANAERVMEELARAKAKKAAEAAASAASTASAGPAQSSTTSQAGAGRSQKQTQGAAASEQAPPESAEDMVERIFGARPSAAPGENPSASADHTQTAAEDDSVDPVGDDVIPETEAVIAPSALGAIISLPPFAIITSLVRRIRGTTAQPQEKAPEIAATANITLDDIIKGQTITVPLTDGREVRFQAAAGMADGHVVHLKGQGLKLQGMLRGDVAVTVQLAPDERFTVKGFDLHAALPVTIENAVLGCETSVEGPHGRINVTVPAWSGSDRTIRVAGQGLPNDQGEKGDLVVELRLMLWEKPDEKITDLMRSMKTGLFL
jgi:DnaJ-class molecular chaperone